MSDQAAMPGQPTAPSGITSAAQPRLPVLPAEIPGLNGLLTLAVGVVVVAALWLGRDLLIPITLAVLLSFVLAPLVGLMRRIRIPRAPSAVIAVLLALGVILTVGSVIGAQLANLAADLPRYQATIESKLGTVRSLTLDRVSEMAARLGRQAERAPDAPSTPASTASAVPGVQPLGGNDARDAAPEPVPPIPVEVHEPSPTPAQLARRILAPVVGPLETLLIVLVVSVFVLSWREDLRDRMIRLFGSADLHRTTAALDEAGHRLSRYFLMQLLLNTAFGCVATAAMFLIGLPSPVLWGILAGLMRFVPYIGTVIACALPVALAAAVEPGWHSVAWTLAFFAVAEPFMGNAVEPLVYGNSTGLSPVSVVIAAIFWTWLWGPIGLLISTPLSLCLVVMGRHVQRLEFLDVLLGDRPALTPVESFYQRMLADDPDEAHDYAEQLLKERPLSSYYDEVAIKGLQLAATDARRGVLTEAQVTRMRDAVAELVEELGSHADAVPAKAGAHRAQEAASEPVAPSHAAKGLPPPAPPPGAGLPGPESLPEAWRAEGAVLCVAGRGPFDDAAAAMLAQLLGKHGVGARTVPYEGTSRSAIGQLDPSSVVMVCVACVEITGTPNHLRSLVRRLRQQLPGVPVLVGLWPAGDAVLADERLRAVPDADCCVSSLHEAVESCLREACRMDDGAAMAA